jgi:hypothetical protein
MRQVSAIVEVRWPGNLSFKANPCWHCSGYYIALEPTKQCIELFMAISAFDVDRWNVTCPDARIKIWKLLC